MDFFTHESNYGFCLTHNSEGSNSSSEGSSYINNPPNAHSDEEVILLASAQPKKRAGRRIFKETRHPVYRGVRLRNKNKWVCEVRVPNNKARIWLGTYPTPEMAARAHDVAALALRGKSACLNFADSTWRLPLPASNKAEEIRRVAMEAAEAFADTEVCSSGVGVLGEAEPGEVEGTAVSESDELLLRSMVDEPLRSPASLEIDRWDWNEVELDTEVSLWSFTI